MEGKSVPSILMTDATMVADAPPPSPKEVPPPSPKEVLPPSPKQAALPSPPSPEVKKQPASRRSSIATARRMSRYHGEDLLFQKFVGSCVLTRVFLIILLYKSDIREGSVQLRLYCPGRVCWERASP